MGVSQKVTLTQGIQSIENNTTEVTFKWTSTQTGSSYNANKRTAKYYVSINGGEEVEYSVTYTLPQSSTKTIVNKTFTVEHTDSGEGSIAIRTWMDTRISEGVVEKSALLDLPTIPRASSFDSLSCSTSYFNGTLTYKYTPKSASFYNEIKAYIKTSENKYAFLETIQLGRNDVTQQTKTLSLNDHLTKIYNHLSNTTNGTLRLELRTYSSETYTSETQIGNMVSRDISLTIPTSIKPSFKSMSIDPDDVTKADNTIATNTLIQGKNKIKISVYGSNAGTGSSIKSYTFDILSGSTIIATQTTTSASITIGPFSQTGDLKFRVTITDNRDRTINNSGSEPTCKCNEYKPPYFTSFDAYRANSDGSANVNGTYLKCVYSPVYSSVNSTNSATVTAYYNGSSKNGASGSVLIDLNGNTTTTYKVYLTIKDNYGGSSKTSTITVLGQARIFNITSDGMGVAVGKMSEKTGSDTNGLFECAFDAKFYKDVTFDNPSSVIKSLGAIGSDGGSLSNSLIVNAQPSGGQGYIIQKTVNEVQEKMQLYISSAGLPSVAFTENGVEANRMVLNRESTLFTKPVHVSSGGTGAINAADARDNLGAAPKCVAVTTTGTDLNDYLEEGWYFFTSSYTPTNIPAGTNGWLQVIDEGLGKGNYVKQLWYRMGTPGNTDHQTFVRTYASSTGWGGWTRYMTEKEAIQMVKLWENTSPDSNFTDTTNAYGGSLKDYTGVMIYFRNTSGDGSLYLSSGYIPKGQSGTLLYTTSAPKQAYRKFTVSDSGVTFESGNLSGSTSNTYCIPIIIYGCKGVG